MGNMEDMKDLEKSKEEELAENAERIQNTISLIKKTCLCAGYDCRYVHVFLCTE